MIEPKTLKGFRDFLPAQTIKRQLVIDKLKKVFELFGFDPLETPALEYAETLMGKYGEEADKLLYLFEDQGKRKVGLRYDQTVPTARVVAQYPELPKPWKRFQIQPVWRAENTQRGRYREFLQCDIDIYGSASYLADCEVIAVAARALSELGFSSYRILVNDRNIFGDLPARAIASIDKLKKIGDDGVKRELAERGFDPTLLDTIKQAHPTETLSQIIETLPELGVAHSVIHFEPTLARGLDYYTSTIVEIEVTDYPVGSICGGGRYDRLIEQFTGQKVPAVGFAFGFDRLVEAMEVLNLLPSEQTKTTVLVTVFEPKYRDESLYLTNKFRDAGIATDIMLSGDAKLDKQLKYADRKGIPFVIIQGPEEIKQGLVQLKNLQTKTQEALTIDQAIEKFR